MLLYMTLRAKEPPYALMFHSQPLAPALEEPNAPDKRRRKQKCTLPMQPGHPSYALQKPHPINDS